MNIYCTKEFPYNLIIALDKPQLVTEDLFRKELQRLIDLAIEDGDNPVNQAIDQLRMWDYPSSPQQLVSSMMSEDAIYNLFGEIDGMQLVEAPEEIIEEYERRTFYSYLIEVMPDQNH